MNNEKLIKLPRQVEEITSQLETNTQNINNIKVNLKDFKTSNNDWNTAFENAYKSLPSIGGTILITELIEITKSINLLDLGTIFGVKRVCIEGKGWFDTCIKKKGDFQGIVSSAGSIIKNLRIDGDNTGTGDGIWVMGAGCVLENVSSFNHGGHGIKIGNKSAYSSINNNVDFCKLYNIHCVENNGYGLVISDEIDSAFNTSDANACAVYSPDIRLNKTGGILIENCIDNHIYSPMCENNTNVGVKVGAECGGIHIYSPYIEKSTTEILLDTGSRSCIVMGSRCGTLNSNIIDRGVGNLIFSRYGAKYSGFYIDNQFNVKNLTVSKKEKNGYFSFEQNDSADMEIISCGSAGKNAIFKSNTGEQDINLHCKSVRMGSKDFLNSVRIRPVSLTGTISVSANSSIERPLSSITNCKADDVVFVNPTEQLPNGVSYYPIVKGENQISIVFVNSTTTSVSIPQITWRVIALNCTAII